MTAALPTRTVVAIKDPHSPLWAIRCLVPCQGRKRFCMRSSVWQDKESGDGFCYLGSGETKEGAEAFARRSGYIVEASP